MHLRIIFLIILTITIIIPTARAQETVATEKAIQKSVQVVIRSPQEIHVKHVVSSANSPKQVKLINGTIANLKISNEEGKEKQFGIIDKNSTVIIFPSQENTVIKYDLKDVLLLKDNVWVWNFKYLETTSFLIPQEVDLIYVNDRPISLGDKKGITCHGCQMNLEYSVDEPKILKNVKLEDKEFFVEIRTFAKVSQFKIDPSTKSINFEINGENQFVTTVIPLKLLSKPYSVFMGDKKINFNEYLDNGTHVWLSMKPHSSGNLSIVGTTIAEISNTNQDNNVYTLLATIVLIVLVVTVILIKRRKKLLIKTKE